MILDMQKYVNGLKELNINVCYNGPLWNDGVKGISDMVKTSLAHKKLSASSSKAVFSIFIEQITNVLMYSVEKEEFSSEIGAISIGMLVMGNNDNVYFVQTGNIIENKSVEFIKNRIDHLNSLDKEGIRQFYKKILRNGDDNPNSKGAGLGFIEIAKRATAPIEYKIEHIDNNLSYFSMYVEVAV